MFSKRIVILANGELPNIEKARAVLRDDDFIIAADGGTRHALALGRTPDAIVGDLDSLPAEFNASAFDGEISLFPRDKNETDLELAIQQAIDMNPVEIVILAALGGRLDQTIGNLFLAAVRHSALIVLDDGIEEALFCRKDARINGAKGDIVSLLPWQGKATGIVTSGLKWPLHNEVLYPQKTRGISNEMLGGTATVQIKSGLLLIVHRRID